MSDQEVERNSPYNLRDRATLRRTIRYGETVNSASITRLKRQRAGKGLALIKRIQQIKGIIQHGGSRTKLRSLQCRLQDFFQEVCVIHESLMNYLDEDEEYDDNYIEDLRMGVDTCISDIDEYLQERAGDPPSRAASENGYLLRDPEHEERTRSWLMEETVGRSGKRGISELTGMFQSLTLSQPDLSYTGVEGAVSTSAASTDYHRLSVASAQGLLSHSREEVASTEDTLLATPGEQPRVESLGTLDRPYKTTLDPPMTEAAYRDLMDNQRALESIYIRSSSPDPVQDPNVTLHDAVTKESGVTRRQTGLYPEIICHPKPREPCSQPSSSYPTNLQSLRRQDGTTGVMHSMSGEQDQHYYQARHGLAGAMKTSISVAEHHPQRLELPRSCFSNSGDKIVAAEDGQLAMSFGELHCRGSQEISCTQGGPHRRIYPVRTEDNYTDFMDGRMIPERSYLQSYSNDTLHAPLVSNGKWDDAVMEKARDSRVQFGLHPNIVFHPNQEEAYDQTVLTHASNFKVQDETQRVAQSMSGEEDQYCGHPKCSLPGQSSTRLDQMNATYSNNNIGRPVYTTAYSQGRMSTGHPQLGRNATALHNGSVRNVAPHQLWSSYTPGQEFCEHPEYSHAEHTHVSGGTAAYSTNSTLPYLDSRYHSSVQPMLQRDVPPTLGYNVGESMNSNTAIDSWIDRLPLREMEFLREVEGNVSNSNLLQRLMVNQQLPRLDIKEFDGSPLLWVEFITQFKELIHFQPYLSIVQRMGYLRQHLVKEAKRAVSGFKTDWLGYRSALQRLKFMFGQRASVAHAHISSVTKGKGLKDDDMTSLIEFYYNISDCLSNLERLGYYSDLASTDVLRQAVSRLPSRLRNKWCEFSYKIRRTHEPSLYHLEGWLKDKVMAARDPYMPQDSFKQNEKRKVDALQALATELNDDEAVAVESLKKSLKKCALCNGDDHFIYKCKAYKESSAGDRFKLVKECKLCFNCLRPNHMTRQCKSNFKCFSPGCEKSHHTTLHDHFHKNPPVERNNETGKEIKKEEEISVSHTSTTTRKVYMKIVPVKVTSENGVTINSYAFLDDGSDGTFIRQDLADRLKLQGKARKITISTLTEGGEALETRNVSFHISGRNRESKEFLMRDAFVLPKDKFMVKSQCLPPNFKTSDRYEHLQELEFENISEEDIQILVGLDNYETVMISEIRKGKQSNYPIAAKTGLGWTLFGGDECYEYNSVRKVNYTKGDELEELESYVHRFWSTEAFGTEFCSDRTFSVQDRLIEMEWKESTKFEDGHYIVPMPWKDPLDSLPNNIHLAEKRFNYLINRFKRNPELHDQYRKNICEYLERGYARRMPPEEVSRTSSKTWYLPHHPVANVNKPGKVRTVFDAAAKCGNVCLNDHLYTGPDYTNSLLGVLLRFRKSPVAFTADIESMFHQVRVANGDCDALRFLWKDDIFDSSPPIVLQMLTHVFGAKSSPGSAGFALKKSAFDSAGKYMDESVSTILRNFYVDDLLKSVNSVDKAFKIATDVIEILASHGFNLVKFTSNSAPLLSKLPEGKLSKNSEVFLLEEDEYASERTLGVIWNAKRDTMTFAGKYNEPQYTKRGILRIVSTIFDPLGYLAPFIIRAKSLLQTLWRKKYSWDSEIDDDDKQAWSKWLAELPFLSKFEIPRCYTKCKPIEHIELHIFADASEIAFGAVAYVRVIYVDGEISCCMLLSKSRLAPIKTLTVPRLELQAAVLAVRLNNIIMSEIDVEFKHVSFWSDSTIILQYISNDTRRFKVFVANRIAEIREHSSPSWWRHIKGEDNPADDMTRGKSVTQIGKDSRWTKGPEFLWKPEDCWPGPQMIENLSPDDPEIKRVATAVVGNVHLERLKNYSSWTKVIRIMSWVLRFTYNCRFKSVSAIKYLTLEELKRGRNATLRYIQRDFYSEELKNLENGERLPSNSSLLPLCVYVDKEDGLMRVGGRLDKCAAPYNAIHQVILPSKHCLVERLVYYEHKISIDCGPNQLLGQLQQNYWIVGAKKLIKKTLWNCLECKKRRCASTCPLMADLPKFRLEMQTPVFFNTGVDFFGPLTTKIGRRSQKRWGALFTCLVTRAVHLELAESLSTDAFIQVLERFINRRGSPNQILSDCGTNFKGANNELIACLKNLQHEKIVDFTSRKMIKWTFIPPDAPHMGGVWERLVRSVKIPLRTILKDRSLTDLQLCTVFTEVECLVNSRPLTAASDDVNDLEALTPNHFLIGRAGPNLPFNVVYKTDNCTRKRWRVVQFITTQFWRRWQKEYLPMLTIRPKWNTETRNLMAGDLVLLSEDNIPRGMWKLGRIVEVLPGDDQRVRVAKVKTRTGTYIRPVVKICLLEEGQIEDGNK